MESAAIPGQLIRPHMEGRRGNMITICVGDQLLTIRPVGKDEVGAVLKVYQQCEDFLALGPVPTASRDTVVEDIERSRESGGVFCGIYTADGEIRLEGDRCFRGSECWLDSKKRISRR